MFIIDFYKIVDWSFNGLIEWLKFGIESVNTLNEENGDDKFIENFDEMELIDEIEIIIKPPVIIAQYS